MSSRPALRRFILLVFLTTVSIAIFKCASYRYDINRETFCRSGNYSASRPLICVDERTLTANPSHARVYDTESKNGRSTGRPVTIHWFSQRTADLRINMITEGCTEPVKCDGLGHCMTQTLRVEGGKEKDCKYGLMIGDKSIDPEDDIILTPCCH